MSDSSGDEFATFDPTTPARIVTARKSAARPPPTNNRLSAGSSSKSQTVPSKRPAPTRHSNATHESIVIESSGDEVGVTGGGENDAVGTAPQTSRPTAKNRATKSSNAKGKARADAPGPSRSAPGTISGSPIELGDALSHGDQPEDPPNGRVSRAKNDSKSRSNPSLSRPSREQENLRYELESLRRQLENVTSERDKYAQQLEELFQIRQTEPEQAFEQLKVQFEARFKTQETIIDELTSQLANTKALGSTGKSAVLHFLTREAADEEKEAVQKEVARWKEVVKERDVKLAQKDKHISELENQEKLLRSDLAAEVERGRVLSSRSQAPVIRSNTAEDPRNAFVVRLYEDMTNLLVVSVKMEKSTFLGLDEPNFTCVYTHKEPSSDRPATSLNFNLRQIYDKQENWDDSKPITKEDLIKRVKFQPRDLQNEPQEFVQNLDFFQEPFVFIQDQLPVFLKTLTEKITDIVQGNTEESDDEKDQLENDVIEIDG
ncbi:uncharacterized protein FIBRA_06583 [Fibroporia radiculosa]|uniref:Monopolin complex subunit Csm1/Pcs1 C-terminal domain-containing protein n=1 Tax=Fibroporia radiculosa TaxID=599839 RepID=J4IBC2_9APHY|nr:uncharacterized protein FIBRA_06583 [Fibroporia radiculosa]CCM04406.1 predicted protein [Fibroporia radiculosa]